MNSNEAEKDPTFREKIIPFSVPKRREILALAESMNHSKGQAIGTVDDMIYEMDSAMQDMIFRWNFCSEAYKKPIHSREGKRQIRKLAAVGIEYLKEIKRGALWKDLSDDYRKGEENEHTRMHL